MPKYDEYARPVEKPGWYKTGYPMSAAVSVVDVSYFRRRGKRLVVRLKPQDGERGEGKLWLGKVSYG